MKTLKIGIAGYDRMRTRTVAISRGEHEPDEPELAQTPHEFSMRDGGQDRHYTMHERPTGRHPAVLRARNGRFPLLRCRARCPLLQRRSSTLPSIPSGHSRTVALRRCNAWPSRIETVAIAVAPVIPVFRREEVSAQERLPGSQLCRRSSRYSRASSPPPRSVRSTRQQRGS